VPTCTAY